MVLNLEKSNYFRSKYIESFVDTSSLYYIDRIKHTKKFSDGRCYTGYLWDCLVNADIIDEDKAEAILREKQNICVMWDIHSCDRIFIPNYWKYPKTSVLFLNKWSECQKKDLPEDIYIFDHTFSWSVILTHEIDLNNERYCLYIDKQ